MNPSRAFMKDVRRVVVKVGTAVVTRSDGKLALWHLGSRCEEVRELLQDGVEVIFVTSGAVGVDSKNLRRHLLMSQSYTEIWMGRHVLQSGRLVCMMACPASILVEFSRIMTVSQLALELKADLLILLSDVEGLYTGPPRDPKSKLIHTYLKEKHDEMVTFDEKSRVGRDGMTAKVYAAWNAESVGIPVVITRISS